MGTEWYSTWDEAFEAAMLNGATRTDAALIADAAVEAAFGFRPGAREKAS